MGRVFALVSCVRSSPADRTEKRVEVGVCGAVETDQGIRRKRRGSGG